MGIKTFHIHLIEKQVQLSPEFAERGMSHFSFLYLTAGEVLVECGGNSYDCQEGHFILMPPETSFRIRFFQNVNGFMGYFHEGILRDGNLPCLRAIEPQVHPYWFEDATFVAEFLNRLLRAEKRGDLSFIVRGLDLLLYTLGGGVKRRMPAVMDVFLDAVFDHGRPLESVSFYADKLNITPGYLNKLSRKWTRRSAMQWIEISRLNLSKRLLEDRTLSVSLVAQQCGLEDASYFTRFFRKWTGMTPSAYRRSIEKS